MTRKLLTAVIILLFSSAFLAFASGEAETTEGGLEISELGIQTQPNPLFATISVAMERGWFQEAGFESVNILEFSSGNMAGEALIAGELHVWLPGNVPVINMRHNGLPVVVVGNLSMAYAEYLMVRDDAGVEEPEDLYDIDIGLIEGSTASAILEALARDNGLDINRLNVVNLPPPEQVTALRNNEIQAMLVWPPSPFRVQDIASYMFESKTYSHTRVPMVFNEDFIRDNPNATRAIVEVLYRAQDFVINNPEEAQQIHAERSEQPLELVQTMWSDYWNEENPPGRIDQQYVDDYRAYTEFLQRRGAISGETVDILEYTYTGILEEIKPDYAEVEGRWQP